MQAAVNAGNSLEAIKLLCEMHGMGLSQAKELIANSMRNTSTGVELEQRSVGTPEVVSRALQAGSKLEAIRWLREIRGISLGEAKEAVDAMQPLDLTAQGAVPKEAHTLYWILVLAESAIAVVSPYYFCAK